MDKQPKEGKKGKSDKVEQKGGFTMPSPVLVKKLAPPAKPSGLSPATAFLRGAAAPGTPMPPKSTPRKKPRAVKVLPVAEESEEPEGPKEDPN